MARLTKEAERINTLCWSYGFDPEIVHALTKEFLEGAKLGYAIIHGSRDIVAAESEIILEKQTRRIQFLDLMVKKGVRNFNKQKIFMYEVLRTPWIWEKISYLLDCMEEFDEVGTGKIYKSILVNTYFNYNPAWKVGNTIGLTEGVIHYRKKEAITLLGISLWIYCEMREKEDVAKGVIKRMQELKK